MWSCLRTSLKHDLKFEPMWTLVYCRAHSNSVRYLQQCPEERACICNINSQNLHRLYIAFSFYRSFKKLQFESIQNAGSSGSMEEIFSLSCNIIKQSNATYNPNNLTMHFPALRRPCLLRLRQAMSAAQEVYTNSSC